MDRAQRGWTANVEDRPTGQDQLVLLFQKWSREYLATPDIACDDVWKDYWAESGTRD